MTSWLVKTSGMSKSSEMTGNTGAIIVDEKGLMKVNIDTDPTVSRVISAQS